MGGCGTVRVQSTSFLTIESLSTCAKAGTIDSIFDPDQFMALDHPYLRGGQIKTIKKDR
jgi:hypothetical protein